MSFQYLFFDSQGFFQWASVAALVAFLSAIIGVFAPVYTAKRTFKNNVVATARIEWIQAVRKQSVEFISSYYELKNYIKKCEPGYFLEPDHDKRIDRIEKDTELSALVNNFREQGTLLTLNFGPDQSGNNIFVDFIVTLLLDRADGLGKYYEDRHFLNQENSIISLRDFLRIYLKAEWKRANGQIKDSELQDYLDRDTLYRRIMEIYEDDMDSHSEHIQSYYDNLEYNLKQNQSN